MDITPTTSVSSLYAATMYASNSRALNNATALAFDPQRMQNEPAGATPPVREETPPRRIERTNPSDDVNMRLNVYDAEGDLMPGVMDRSETSAATNTRLLEQEDSAQGLPEYPQQLFTNLAGSINAQNTATIAQNMSRTQEFSQALNASANDTQVALQSTAESAQNAVNERQQQGRVSQDTTRELLQNASDFVNNYNDTLNTINESPNRSRQVATISSTMENAVSNNEEELENIGITENEDGTLTLDEDRFAQVAQDNPQAIQNVFSENRNFATDLNRALDAAEDTRSVNRAEINASLNTENTFTTYQGVLQSSSLVSMSNIPVGTLLNMLA